MNHQYYLTVNPDGVFHAFKEMPHRHSFQGYIGYVDEEDVNFKPVNKYITCWSTINGSPDLLQRSSYATDEENPNIKYPLYQIGETIPVTLIDEDLRNLTWNDNPVLVETKFVRKHGKNN